MSSIKKNIMQTLKVVVLALVLIAGVNYAFAVDWTPPTATPPGGNTPAPLNVSSLGQIKSGGLVLNAARNAPVALKVMNGASENGLIVQDNGQVGIGVTLPTTASLDIFGNIRIRGGSPAAGKVLTSDATGIGTWQAPTGGTGGGITGGVADKIPKFLNATTLTNSGITENSSGQVGIGVIPTAKLDVDGNIRVRGSGAGFLPATGKVLTATNSTGLAAWQTGVEVGTAILSTSQASPSLTGQICGLTANKRFLATAHLSSFSSPSQALPTGLNISLSVNGVSNTQASIKVESIFTPVSIAVVANSTSDGNGCLNASVTVPNIYFYGGQTAILSIVG